MKSIPALSSLITKGLEISATLVGENLILRVIFDDSMKIRVGEKLVSTALNYGWTYHSKAPESLLFRRDLKATAKHTSIASEFIPILIALSVDPYQDWGM